MHIFWHFSNAATLERRLHNQSWSTSYPLWAGGNPGPEIESCSIIKNFISSKYLFFVSSFPLYCLDLKWIWFLTSSFISPSVLCSTLSFPKNMHLEHNAFNWENLSTWYALWGFQSYLPELTPDMKIICIISQGLEDRCPWAIVCHVEENQLYAVWCWDVSRHSMLRYHKMKVENFKTETFLWHGPAHHYIILVNTIKKFLNTKNLLNFQKESSPGPQCILTQCRHRWKRAGL